MVHFSLIHVYKKYNIILRPKKVATNKFDLYEKILNNLEKYSNYDFGINEIIEKYDDGKRIKKNLISLNKKAKDMQIEMKEMLNENFKNNECMKYTHFLFDGAYTKYTGMDKKYFDKLKNDK